MPGPPPPPSTETTPLKPSTFQPSRNRRITYKFVLGVGFALIALFIGSMAAGYTTGLNSYCNPAVRAAFMRQREMEIRHQEEQRRQWEFEKAEWQERRDEWEKERDEWEKERDEWAQERRRRMEEKKRKEAIRRAHVKFEIPSPHKSCLSYGTREYSAQLLNVPDDLNALELCNDAEGSIHGVMKRPDYCEDKGKWAGVFGHWRVDFQEAACKPSFSTFDDKGCLNDGSGIRIYHSHLENLRDSDDWEIMCSTTPADFLQHHFDGPTHCANWGSHGIWGIWEVRDTSC